MKFELNLLQNSHDYINNSFDLYLIADEFGTHDEQRTLFKNKVRWKLAFITMVQAFELLLKEILYQVHPNLIYENIDAEKVTDRNTISFRQAINRINNFTDYSIEKEKKQFLINCSKLRNEFIHYKVNIQSEQIKSKYSKLYSFYKELHSKLVGEKIIEYYDENHKNTEFEILIYEENWTVFRGREIRKDTLEEFIGEIEKNKNFKYYVNKEGDKVKRIKFGDEINRVSRDYINKYCLSLYSDFEICDDCNAKREEFHLDGCDLEICPFCFGQKLSCGCVELMEL
ncbi:hypothetical protein SAMN05660297_03421 [Natronincola peptidivorans]|uniref:Uncharacterized protein n=1 Tax=Natronincola peptidivorans TaxID=426128 RepID=A0A1I0GY92_9FIRM|nr:hypothetical protein [Natronincola peptidivorans]SET76172.1 hypothetical protein SAMN05660297_03421 [Natronincola peptidivorans]